MANAAKREARRQARLERRAEEEARQRRSGQLRMVALIGGVILLIGVAAFAVVRSRPASTASPSPASPPIVTVADQGREHVAPGTPHPPYNSNPPASGWHYATTANWGFHNTDFPDELLIHNLEHGGIWIAYKNDQDPAIVDPLVALAREFPRKLVITHRPRNDSPLAVVAWGRVMTLDRYDRAAIVDFYNRFKNKGPEFVPD